MDGDVARASTNIDIAFANFLDFNIATAGLDARRPGKLAASHVARSGLEAQVAGEARQLHVAGTGFKVNRSLDALDTLIAAATVSANRGVLRDSDLVVDRDIAVIHIVDANAVSVLPDGRILLDLLHVVFRRFLEPGVAGMNLAMNRDCSSRSAAHGDVARAGKDFEIHRPIDLKRPVKATRDGCKSGEGSSKHKQQCTNCV